MSNIYSILETDLNDFIKYNNTNKIIVFYKQDCLYCKLLINDLNKLANTYNQNIEYAIIDLTNKKHYCLDHNIITFPTTYVYKDGELLYKLDKYVKHEVLEEIIKNLNNCPLTIEELSKLINENEVTLKDLAKIYNKQ